MSWCWICSCPAIQAGTFTGQHSTFVLACHRIGADDEEK